MISLFSNTFKSVGETLNFFPASSNILFAPSFGNWGIFFPLSPTHCLHLTHSTFNLPCLTHSISDPVNKKRPTRPSRFSSTKHITTPHHHRSPTSIPALHRSLSITRRNPISSNHLQKIPFHLNPWAKTNLTTPAPTSPQLTSPSRAEKKSEKEEEKERSREGEKSRDKVKSIPKPILSFARNPKTKTPTLATPSPPNPAHRRTEHLLPPLQVMSVAPGDVDSSADFHQLVQAHQAAAARLPPLEEIRTLLNRSTRGMLSTFSQTNELYQLASVAFCLFLA